MTCHPFGLWQGLGLGALAVFLAWWGWSFIEQGRPDATPVRRQRTALLLVALNLGLVALTWLAARQHFCG